MDKESFSFKDVNQLDELLESFENRLRDYLLQNDIERSNEIDGEIFDMYDDVRELRTFLKVAVDEYDEKNEIDEGLKERISEKFSSLGLLEKAGAAATIMEFLNQILKLIGR